MNPLTITCPDCTAAATVDITGAGVNHIVLVHDVSCPRLSRATRRRSTQDHKEHGD